MFFYYTRWSFLWALVILILCGIPGRDIPHISFLELLSFDKFVHAGIFYVLVLLAIRGLKLQYRFAKLQRRPERYAVPTAILYGGLLEIMQGTLFSERSADVFDFIANGFGCILAWISYSKIEKLVLSKWIK